MPDIGARTMLEEVVRDALLRRRCFVAFSGGRDSSAILAVAAHVARRDGLPVPVAVTQTFSGAPETDESQWQQAVIDHLGVKEWIRIPSHDDADLLGAAATDGLRRRGVLWPPAVHGQHGLLRAATGGTLLSGEGGDEILAGRRITPVALIAREHRRVSSGLLAAAAWASAPRSLRYRRMRRTLEHSVGQRWLRPAVRARHLDLVAADAVSEPWRWDESTRWLRSRAAVQVVQHNAAAVAAEYDVELCDPLLDSRFVDALARAGGTWGFAGRTALMRKLCADLLPDHVLSRASKASFNTVHFGPAARTFAGGWDGSGVDERFVEPEALRREWLSDRPAGVSGLLLQQAWLASQGRR